MLITMKEQEIYDLLLFTVQRHREGNYSFKNKLGYQYFWNNGVLKYGNGKELKFNETTRKEVEKGLESCFNHVGKIEHVFTPFDYYGEDLLPVGGFNLGSLEISDFSQASFNYSYSKNVSDLLYWGITEESYEYKIYKEGDKYTLKPIRKNFNSVPTPYQSYADVIFKGNKIIDKRYYPERDITYTEVDDIAWNLKQVEYLDKCYYNHYKVKIGYNSVSNRYKIINSDISKNIDESPWCRVETVDGSVFYLINKVYDKYDITEYKVYEDKIEIPTIDFKKGFRAERFLDRLKVMRSNLKIAAEHNIRVKFFFDRNTQEFYFIPDLDFELKDMYKCTN